MLSVIMVGQNILVKRRINAPKPPTRMRKQTFHEAREIQKHLKEQDIAINAILDRIERMEANLKKS